MQSLAAFVLFCTFSLFMSLMSPQAQQTPPQTAGASGVVIEAPVLSAFAAADSGIDHVVGISTFVRNFEGSGIFGRLFPEIATMPLASNGAVIPDPERLLWLRPQAVVAWAGQAESLRMTGFPGLVELRYASGAKLPEIWMALARVAGREARAAEMMAGIGTRRAHLIQSLPKSDPVPRILPVSTSNGRWWFGRRNYFLNTVLEEVGAVNPARDMTYNGISGAEEILRLDPDIIVLPNGIDPALPQQLYADPQWQALRAVRERRVYLLPRGSLFNLAVDYALWPIWLAELLHPSLPRQIRAAYRELYEQAYNRSLSEDEIDEALAMSENKTSTGYDRFARKP